MPTECGRESAVQKMRQRVLEPRRIHGRAFTEAPGMRDRPGSGSDSSQDRAIDPSVSWFRTVLVAKNEAHICKLENRKSVTRTGSELLFGKDGNF